MFQCAEFPSLEAILDEFMPARRVERRRASASRARSSTGVAKITNLPWVIDARVLAQQARRAGDAAQRSAGHRARHARVAGRRVRGAAGRGAARPARHDRRDRARHRASARRCSSTMARRYVALPSEGGHADFAPGTDEEIELLAVPARASRRARLGRARAVGQRHRRPLRLLPRRRRARAGVARKRRSQRRRSPMPRSRSPMPNVVRALDLFAELLGAEAGNLALRGIDDRRRRDRRRHPAEDPAGAADRRGSSRASVDKGRFAALDAGARRARRTRASRGAARRRALRRSTSRGLTYGPTYARHRRSRRRDPRRGPARSAAGRSRPAIVIFGATGDLTGRKLAPALYNLMLDGSLAEPTVIIGVSRGEMTAQQFAEQLCGRASPSTRARRSSPRRGTKFVCDARLRRRRVRTTTRPTSRSRQKLEAAKAKGTRGNRVFYLSTPPAVFPVILEKLHQHKLIERARAEDRAAVVPRDRREAVRPRPHERARSSTR